MYYIYCYTNKINGHKYVGQTNNIERRKREHRSVSNNLTSKGYNDMFHQKLREYGEENFIFSILEEIEDENILNQQEEFWIKEMQSFIQTGKGYNLTEGGDGVRNLNRKLSNEEMLLLVEDIKTGNSYESLNKKYDLSIAYISMINSGLCFKQSNETYPLYRYYKSNEDYKELVELLLYSDLTLKDISEKLQIGYSTVKKINAGSLRKGLSSEYPIRKLTPQQRKAERIKELLLLGATNQEIVMETGVSRETIKRINSGETNYDPSLNYPLR